MKKVLIDPGHEYGNENKGLNGYYEHEGVLKISRYMKAMLESYGVICDLTRGEYDSLDTRS